MRLPDPAPASMSRGSLEAVAGDLEQRSEDEAEVVDAIIVHEPRSSAVARSQRVVAAQAVVVATTTFVAGAATLALVSRRRGKPVLKPTLARRTTAPPLLEVVSSQRFIVDVHRIQSR